MNYFWSNTPKFNLQYFRYQSYRRMWYATARHWWIFKIRNRFIKPSTKRYDWRNERGFLVSEENNCYISPAYPDPWECSKEWKPTLLPGDTLEGIARISAERKAKRLRDGAAADGK